jgi:hypothetical protein
MMNGPICWKSNRAPVAHWQCIARPPTGQPAEGSGKPEWLGMRMQENNDEAVFVAQNDT